MLILPACHNNKIDILPVCPSNTLNKWQSLYTEVTSLFKFYNIFDHIWPMRHYVKIHIEDKILFIASRNTSKTSPYATQKERKIKNQKKSKISTNNRIKLSLTTEHNKLNTDNSKIFLCMAFHVYQYSQPKLHNFHYWIIPVNQNSCANLFSPDKRNRSKAKSKIHLLNSPFQIGWIFFSIVTQFLSPFKLATVSYIDKNCQ